MKKQWTDTEVGKALRDLRDETPDPGYWETRVWAKIEERLEKPWYARAGFARWAMAAVFLVAVTGVLQYRHRASDDELGVELAELIATSDAGTGDPEADVAREILQGNFRDETDPDSADESITVMDDVYESI